MYYKCLIQIGNYRIYTDSLRYFVRRRNMQTGEWFCEKTCASYDEAMFYLTRKGIV